MATHVVEHDKDSAAVPYTGTKAAMDGSEAVIWVEAHTTQGACAYPITPSTSMGVFYQAEVAQGKQNLWGETLFFVEPESEHSSASAAEGYAAAGGRVANFTSGQGLILMKEVLYVISGKRLPVVFQIGARTMTSQSLNIHCGHDDIMGVSDTGWAIVFGRTAQEAADLALICRRAAEASETPFFNVQDGFLTTHTVESLLLPEPEMMEKFVGNPNDKMRTLFDLENPRLVGSVQNQDSYMKGKIAQRYFTDKVPDALADAFAQYKSLTGREYDFVDGYRMEDAEYAIVGMGSMMETAQATVDWLRENRGMKVGAVHVTVYRPFPGPQLVAMLKQCRSVAIVEKMDNPMGQSNPLASEIKGAFADAATGSAGYPVVERIPNLMCGVAGVGGRDVRPGDFIAVATALEAGRRDDFVLGIRHPMALERTVDPDVRPEGSFSMRGHSIGGFGSVTTNKIIASVAAEVFGKYVQAFPKYGSEKKGLPTSYYLTAGDSHVRVHSELAKVEMVAVHDLTAFEQGDPTAGLVDGGTLFLNTGKNAEEIWKLLPVKAARKIKENKYKVVALDTLELAREFAPTAELSVRMQGIALMGVFLRLTPFAQEMDLSEDHLFAGVRKALNKYFGKRGAKVVEANLKVAQAAYEKVAEIPPPENLPEPVGGPVSLPIIAGPIEPDTGGDRGVIRPELFDAVMDAYEAGQDSILDADMDVARSLMASASGARRDFTHLAPDIPEFFHDKCVGCMECITECPDSAIFGRVIEPQNLDKALKGENGQGDAIKTMFIETKKYWNVHEKKGEGGGLFSLAFDPTKCKGCGECVDVCGSHDALKMIPKNPEIMDWHTKTNDFLHALPDTPRRFLSERALADIMLADDAWDYVGGAGSCMGCGEVTAIRMMMAATGFQYGPKSYGIVAATGCNTVYGSTYPYNPFAVPWINSLFENAPTVAMGVRGRWDQIGQQDKKLWVFGGDGAMYDIGFQALSRMLASGADIKVLVMDTQVYSNTGGQASTASFGGQEAKMAAHGSAIAGKTERRKELGLIAMMHPNVYVSQTTPAHINHFYKSILEANEFPGPAVVIAYSPCQPEHGIADDASAQACKLVVESRTFPLYTYDPRKGEGIADRMDLKGNPALKEDWYTNPKTDERIDFTYFARTEGRFRRQFDKEGKPSEALLASQEDRLANWRTLQQLAGIRPLKTEPPPKQ